LINKIEYSLAIYGSIVMKIGQQFVENGRHLIKSPFFQTDVRK